MIDKIRKLATPILLLVTLIITVTAVMAAPEGPGSFDTGAIGFRAPAANQTFGVQAGNVTNLNLSGQSVTQSWSGFYGNITGTITLDDSAGNTIYDWALANPGGEVYATTDADVDWTASNLQCYQIDNTSTASYYTLAEYETDLGLATLDVDGVNETFHTDTTHAGFVTGSKSFTQDGCPAAQLHNNAGKSANFQEILIQQIDVVNTAASVIYVSLIADSTTGFQGSPVDFELIVGEDGNGSDLATTTYYFFVELE